jgi:hypothetical protein
MSLIPPPNVANSERPTIPAGPQGRAKKAAEGGATMNPPGAAKGDQTVERGPAPGKIDYLTGLDVSRGPVTIKKIVVQDRRGANDFLTAILAPNAKHSGVIEELVEAVGGEKAAAKLGLVRHRTFSNAFGLFDSMSGRPQYEVPCVVNKSFDPQSYAGRPDSLIATLSPAITDAIKARGVEVPQMSTSGIGTYVGEDGRAALGVEGYNLIA